MSNGNKLRVFIALPLPEYVVMFLKALQRDIMSIGFKASWSRMDAVHLTLAFMGDIDPDQVPVLIRALGLAAEGSEGFSLHAGGVGVFPSVKNARVIWAGVKGETDRLAGLHARLWTCLAQEGFPGESGRFAPHLTLARLKGYSDPKVMVAMIQKFQDFRSEVFACESVCLFKSDLLGSGAVHTCLFRAPLKGASPWIL
ncbi:MAG: RNA 2',3'-cyclic phosphodiesterase [Pseudomonadota bacterium]